MIATEQKFGILSPALGVREDFPSIFLSKAFSPESENCLLRYGEVHRVRGRLKELLDGSDAKTQTPDANPVIKYHLHITTGGLEYLFAFTKAHIYYWNTANKVYDEKFACGSDCTHWSVVSFNQKIIATNGVDKVQVLSDSAIGSNFAALDGASGLDLTGGGSPTLLTAAKYVTTYENYVIFGYTTEGGTVFPQRIRWCTGGDETDYDENGSGDTGAKDFAGSDFLMGFGKYGPFNIVFKQCSTYIMTLSEINVFDYDVEHINIGCLATDSIINDKEGKLYWLADDYSIREFRRGKISDAVDKTLKSLNPNSTLKLVDYVSAGYIDEYDEIWWSVPYGDSSTGNNRILAYKPKDATWEIHTFPVRAFGTFSRQTVYTIDTIPYSDIDNIGWPHIDTVENVVGFPLDLASDYSGYTYDLHSAENDNATSYSGRAVFATDLSEKGSLSEYKRISNIQAYFKKEGTGTALLEAKEENEVNWQTLKSVSLTDAGYDIIRRDVSCDLRARDFLFRISATNAFRFLGMIITFEMDGDR